MAERTLHTLLSSVTAHSFDAVVGLVRGARRVLLVADGGTHALCSDLAFRLTSSGRVAELSPDTILQHVPAGATAAEQRGSGAWPAGRPVSRSSAQPRASCSSRWLAPR